MRIAIGRETNRSEVPPGPLLSVSKRVSNGHVLGSHRDRPIGLGVARYERSSGGCSAITIGVGVKPYWGLGALGGLGLGQGVGSGVSAGTGWAGLGQGGGGSRVRTPTGRRTPAGALHYIFNVSALKAVVKMPECECPL